MYSGGAVSGRETAALKLPKESLIRATAEFAQCYASGRRLHTRHFLLFVAPPSENGLSLCMGFAVSRKTGHAVVRNRIKRLLRECFRLTVRHLPVTARIVVVAKRQAGTDGLGLAEVTEELTGALSRHFHLPQGNCSCL